MRRRADGTLGGSLAICMAPREGVRPPLRVSFEALVAGLESRAHWANPGGLLPSRGLPLIGTPRAA